MKRNNSSFKKNEYEEYCSKYGTFTQSTLWANVKNNWQKKGKR